jgi:phosphohistidine phosphatase
MKTIFLVRHAKSSWKDKSIADIDRPLAKRGRRAARSLGQYLAQQQMQPAQILCSPAQRTRETLARMEKQFDAAVPVRYEKAIYLAEAPALLRRLRRLNDSLPSVMLIGHNPGLENLVRLLIGSTAEAANRLPEKFATGSLAVLAAATDEWRGLDTGGAELIAFVRPKDLMAE